MHFVEIPSGESKFAASCWLFDEVLEDIECKDSYDSNLDESTFLVTYLSDSNEDGFFTPRDDVELLLHHDPSISIVSILEGFIDEPPLEENDDLFDLESKENDWKKILYDAQLMIELPRIPYDHEDPCLFSILQSSGLRSFTYFGILNPDHVQRIENEYFRVRFDQV
ncbi:hypothetical protein Tco_0966034 [Tanacetum coccineum]